jgi:hypothetical protein
MIKLKTILGEGYAWEREAGKPLPTLEQTTAAYAAKMQEQSNDQDISSPMESYSSMSDRQLMSAAESAGMEEMIIVGYDGELENRDEIISLLNSDMQMEQAKPDYIDADSDGDEKESMKKAFADKEDKSVNELSDDEIDARWNKPQQNWQRQFNSSQMDVKSNDMSKSSNGGVSKFYQEKLAALEAERQQIEFDMEQEAEPEGGPIADYYGGALENIDNQISAVRSKMNKNESTFTTKAGLQEMRELPLEQRILRNLKGNDYILSETFKK